MLSVLINLNHYVGKTLTEIYRTKQNRPIISRRVQKHGYNTICIFTFVTFGICYSFNFFPLNYTRYFSCILKYWTDERLNNWKSILVLRNVSIHTD